MFGKRKVKREVSKLSLEPGDLVVLRTNKNFREWIKVLEVIIRRIKIYKNVSVTALVLPIDVRFGKVSEKEMNAAGWFKQDKEKVKRILDDNIMLRDWNVGIKQLHIDDSMKAHEEKEILKERLKKYENGKG
jgi:hypothetical protein